MRRTLLDYVPRGNTLEDGAWCRRGHAVTPAARPAPIVEIAAALGVPVGVARVLVGDLAAAGHVRVHQPDHAGRDDGPGQEILGRLLDGLRAR